MTGSDRKTLEAVAQDDEHPTAGRWLIEPGRTAAAIRAALARIDELEAEVARLRRHGRPL